MSFRCALFGLLAAAFAPAAEPNRAGPDWWSLRPISRPTPPAAADLSGANPIDAFVRAKLTAAGLRPAAPAEKLTLIRRVTFDLTGLPPTPAEIDAFLADDRPGAYERVVDRLLASPHYGERWARHWLDVVRYSESHGFEYDRLRDHAWRYRDYVIRSLNADKPYADFVREQITGDVVAPAARHGVIATGMLVAGPNDQAGRISASAVVRGRAREDELEDMLGTVGQTFLGVTINCARCHDHKFDPLTARDYYRLKAVFDGVHPGDRPLYLPDELRAREGWLAAPLAALRQSEMAYAANPKQPAPTRLLKRGDVEKPGDAVTAGSPAVIKGPPPVDLPGDAPEGERRRRFAEWVVHPENPLTWRVIVNRVWQHPFGEGLVRTPNDFGFNGERPTHPELLDWLASWIRDSGGRLKALHRLIVTSDTYRQSSAFDARAAEVDADNRLLWRFAPRRLEAEAIRDAMLAVSGRLNRAAGGPSARPFRVETFNSAFYIPFDADRPEFNRRSVYRMNVTSSRDPVLDVLDCPDPSVKTPRRNATTTPLSALTLMNNPFTDRMARSFAERVRHEAGDAPEDQVTLAYRLALGRPPTAAERVRAVTVVRDAGLKSVCWALLNSSEFAYVK